MCKTSSISFNKNESTLQANTHKVTKVQWFSL